MIWFSHLRCAGCGLKIEAAFDGVSKTKKQAYEEARCMAAAKCWYLRKGEHSFCHACRCSGSGDDLVDEIIAEILMEENT